MSARDEDRAEQARELGRQRWNRMIRREEEQLLAGVIQEATEIAKDAARRSR